MTRGLRIGVPRRYVATLFNGTYSHTGQDATLTYTPAIDNTPNQFTFTDQTGVALSSTTTSAAVTISGLGSGVSITLNASGGTIDLNGNGVFLGSQIVQNGDTVRARVTSSASNSVAVDCVVVASPSGVTDTFSATTLAASGINFYISPTGSDSNPGTLSQPWALTAINSKRATYAGQTVGLLDGTYGMVTIMGQPSTTSGQSQRGRLKIAGGSAGNPTVIKAVNQRGAIIDWQRSSQTNNSMEASMSIIGDYVNIDGLVFLNNNYQCILNNPNSGEGSGAHIRITNCTFQDQSFTLVPAVLQNSCCIYSEGKADIYVAYCYFENCNAPNDSDRHSHIEIYSPTNTALVEYCTAVASRSANWSGDFVFCKVEGNTNITIRYCFYDAFNAKDVFFQTWGDGTTASTYSIHHNIFNRPAVTGDSVFLLRNGNGVQGTWDVYQNTFICAVTLDTSGLEQLGTKSPVALNFWNNVFYITAGGSTWGQMDLPATSKLGTFSNNLYNSGVTLVVRYNNRASVANGFSSWQSVSGKEANSVNTAQTQAQLFAQSGSGAAYYQPKAGTSALLGAGLSGANIGAWDGSVTQIGYI